MKKKIVQHIGTLWRSWKSRVTSDLKQALEDGWSDDEINSKLQPEGVDLADWSTFRKERESTAFKETSKKFKELRSKHKLPHTTSRKGYARLEEEMKAKSGRGDISRADLWIEGHKNKKGQPHNDEIVGVVEKINECQRRSSASSSQSINKDPIAQVFGPEHQGRVRGLGFGVTPSNVRATTQSTILVRKLQADFRRLEEKHEQLAKLIRSQQMTPSSRQQQNNPPNICGKKCMILDWLSPKKIVGEGEVETDDPMHLVDGIPIGGNAYLVYVERVFEPNAFLWRNQNNWTTLDNALGETKEDACLGGKGIEGEMSSVDKGREATTPLLDKEGQWDGEFTEDGSLDFHGRTALRQSTGGWRTASIVLETFKNISITVTAFAIGYKPCWRLALVVTVMFPILIAASIAENLSRDLGDYSKAYSRAIALASEAITNIYTVAAFGSEDMITKQFSSELRRSNKKALLRAHITTIGFGTSHCLAYFSYALGLWYSSKLIKNKESNFGDTLKTFIVLIFTATTIAETFGVAPDIVKGTKALESVFSILERRTEIEPEDSISL
ncbi:hypothetical protein Sjap_016219 [Stephania japonica]|uniref:ABC transmembrane type-1 domain-containing protein n=1 Tax=Stephania japonica TaxID=461633 RepID=A0AAP0IML4_9MAGN